VVVTHDVESFERWKRAFDAHATSRRTAGIVSAHINRDADDPNKLSIYLAGTDAGKLDAFLKSTDLANTMLDAGVKGPPHVAAITPVEDKTVKQPLPGIIVRHAVTDYATWKRAFDADGARRTAAGIVGHAVNRAPQDKNLVIVYLQAQSLDTLRAFAGSPELKRVMHDAGIVGAPAITFVQGGSWES
jgi:hypothetical protein